MTTPTPPSAYATSDELATYMQKTFDPLQEASATLFLGFMAMLIRNEYSDIDSRTPPIDPNIPKLVSLELVSRKMNETSAGGATSVTESMDDITYTTTHSPKFGGMTLDQWAKDLLSPDSSTGPKAFGIKRSSTATVPNNPWDSLDVTGYVYESYPWHY